MNTKKMTAFIVGAMLIATVLVMAVSAAGFDRDKYLGMPRMVYEFDAVDDTGIYINDVDVTVDCVWNPDLDIWVPEIETVPTLRIYGEEGAIYPTHSYYGTDDFVYPDPVDPFDPGIMAKDSVTFNPAYMRDAVSVDGDWPKEHDEKVFKRVFYEPGYAHGVDTLMDDTLPTTYPPLAPVTMLDGALVTETTYMMVKAGSCSSGLPLTGAAGVTRFKLPTLSEAAPSDLNPGMDDWTDDNLATDDLVDLLFADYGDAPTNGTIEVGIEVHLAVGESKRFMDHNITLRETCGINSKFEIGYIGNRNDGDVELQDVLVPNGGHTVYVTRYNNKEHPPLYQFLTTDAEHRWFVRDVTPDGNCDGCIVTIGRRLVAGETFYVDGVRYDMPAIYVTDGDEFKYITFQSPIPKCLDCECDDMMDYSHVSCQWLAMLCMSDPAPGCPDTADLHYVWVLPPFNVPHLKIDDINLAEGGCPVGNITVNEAGEIFYGPDEALEFYYIEEYIEERFNSSLAERHHIRKDGVEIWNWWNVYTKPYNYTTLVLPDDEETGEMYCRTGITTADGDEYIVTTSFIAPNSEADNRHPDCKDPETHDIIDRAATIALSGDTSRDAYDGMPRMVFEYDAVDTDDLFVNDDGDGSPTVRVYGEEGAIYPTHSMTGADDFIYPDAVDPFDPGIIPKDSVTFNPAYIEDTYYGRIKYYSDEHGYGLDGEEKVFLRAFYEPGYAHDTDAKMPGILPVEMPNGAFVTETTYMLTTDNHDSGHSGDPVAARAQLGYENEAYTKFILPTESTNSGKPGMENARLVGLTNASGAGTSQLTDGEIDVDLKRLLYIGDTVDFMDHRYELVDVTENGEVTLKITYLGNMYGYEEMFVIHTALDEDQRYWLTRDNNVELSSLPARRPYFEITDRYYKGDWADMHHIAITVGRRLVAGETFYVDGMRYDMPAIYVTDDDRFKYITLQSPMPKCEEVTWYEDDPELNLKDISHVSSQWLANLIPNEDVPVLPPFNHRHMMIDDIDLAKFNTGTAAEPDWEICTEAGNIIEGRKGPLMFHYIDETIEERFDSNLAERHNITDGREEWDWWNIFTKPYHYTELWLPNQEMPGETYAASDPCMPTTGADGNEYLITTSFIAPNCEGEQRVNLSKSSDERHDIIDRASTLLGGSGPTQICGDVNDDGNVNTLDVTTLFDHVTAGSPYESVADVNGDGSVNTLDVTTLFDFVTYGVPALNCP